MTNFCVTNTLKLQLLNRYKNRYNCDFLQSTNLNVTILSRFVTILLCFVTINVTIFLSCDLQCNDFFGKCVYTLIFQKDINIKE